MTNDSQRTYTVLEAAKKAGIHRTTLIRWLEEGHVKASHETRMAKSGHIYRAFTGEDIQKIRDYHKDHYWEITYKRGSNEMPKKDEREELITELVKELPELLADYEHLAPDSDGNIDAHRKRRIKRVGTLLQKIQKTR